MKVVATASELSKSAGGVFVPTMGALHEGHLSLIRQARGIAGMGSPVVVSIFVNPTQFAPTEDLSRYPRTLEADLKGCEAAGADVVFTPGVETIYPPAKEVAVPRLPLVATEPKLEDAARPSHFAGVCQVVMRLFELVKPTAAVFGEKDWQQLQVVTAMTHEAGLRIRIVPGATVRESDGLAMSSRNRFLSPEDRQRGLGLSRSLRAAQGAKDPDEAEARMVAELEKAGVKVDYAVVRDGRTLMPRVKGVWDRSAVMRAVVAGRVGTVRLLDNAAWLPA